MQPRDRVAAVIEHRRPDRIPIYAWLRANLTDQLTEAFGSVEAFEDRYEFDFAHLFGGPHPYPPEALNALRAEIGGPIGPRQLLDIPLMDPDNLSAYRDVTTAIEHHKGARGRFVYMQTPGIFECLNGPFGIENHLMYLALYEDDLREVYARQAEWNRRFALNCLDLGVDMIHVSDDWGAQNGLMFSPDTWWRLIHPYHKVTCDAVLSRGGYLSLHTDGNVMAILDGIADLGYQVLHPYQRSAGMDVDIYRSRYADAFVLMGGIDIQTTLGFGDRPRLEREIEELVGMFRDGGLLLCTSHFVQDHCTVDELVFAYDLIYSLIRQNA